MSETGDISMEDVLDVKKYTKAVDPEGRNTVASSVVEKRAENLGNLLSNRTQQNELSEKAEGFKQQAEEAKQSIYKDTTTRNERQNSILGRILRAVRIGDPVTKNIEEQLQQTSRIENEAIQAQSTTLQEKQRLEKDEETLKDSRKGLKGEVDKYYEKWRYDTLTPEQKKELFKTENLKGLTTEEYLEIWRRGSPYFVSHVTRQGFRDHNAMFYHSAGMNEFADGFTKVLKDERTMRDPLYIHGLKDLNPDTVSTFLNNTYLAGDFVFSEPDAKSAKSKFFTAFNHTLASAPFYPDKTAVHFGAQTVLDEYYGAERANELVFVFPADFIASQHQFAFNGWEKDFTKPQSEAKWNDVFVWPGDEKGIPVDAGFVFIPENAKVDPNTGSRYASAEVEVDGVKKKVMIDDKNAPAQFRSWLEENAQKLDEYENEWKAASGWDSNGTQRSIMYRISEDLMKQGWEGHEAWIGARQILQKHYLLPDVTKWNDESILGILGETGKIYKKPDVTISSKDYWDKYFTEHPDEKPAHILYYDGDPTTGIYNKLQKEGIAEKGKQNDPLLGFPEHHVTDMKNDPRVNKGYDEVVATAYKLIDAHYSNNLQPAA